MPHPTVVLVAGVPGAGKTTLAKQLGAALFMPVVVRDEVKESLTRTHAIPTDDRAASQALGADAFDAFFRIVDTFIAHGVSVVAEAALQREGSRPFVTAWTEAARVVVVHCTVSDDLAVQRYAERAARGERHPSHVDIAVVEQMRTEGPGFERYAVAADLALPTIAVDTTDGYFPSLNEIVAFVERNAGSEET